MTIIDALQAVGLDGSVGWVVLGFAVLSTVAGAISAAMPDSSFGKLFSSIVNALALNIGKAKNDPADQ